MDFFEAQDRARRRSKSLVLLFALAVAGTIAAGYVSTLLILNQAGNVERRGQSFQYSADDAAPIVWWNPQIFLWVAAGTIGVVGFASLYKWSQMRGGGAAVAEMVGGRAVDLNTTDLRERQLLNVVEEMAIASGIPVPAVYILENEPGLNAFAAGLRTTDAAVAVTRGTLNRLTRDELQGVIAHEFSHILNGDMRLNVQISAIVFGILVVGLIGRGVLRGMMYGRMRPSGGGKDKNAGTLVFIAIGLALFLIGYVGYFFGRLIQAAVSRQREFLADASAVQFTRNADGIAGALKKIGGYALGGTIVNNHAGEIGHFFFAQAFRSGLTGLLSTHPSLDKRIRAIDPRWDGKLFEPPEVVNVAQESFAMAGFNAGPRSSANNPSRPGDAAPPVLVPPVLKARIAFQPAGVVADIGALTDAHFRHAHLLLESIPDGLRQAAREATSAPALVYGLLFSGDHSARNKQQELVVQHAGGSTAEQLARLLPALSVLDPVVRLPLLQLALAALRQMDAAARDRFATTLDELVHADGNVTPYEYAMQKMVLNQLFAVPTKQKHVHFDSFAAVRNEIAVVLSALAHFSPNNSSEAFAAGLAQLPVLANQIGLLPADACGLEQVDAALDKLAASSLPIKKRLLVAAGHVIASDGSVTATEGELYRALAATLDVPMPSLSAA